MSTLSYFDKYVARNSAIASRVLGDETIVMSTVDSTLFTLNQTASAIWHAANGSTRLSRIVEEAVCAEFDVTPETARADAQELVEKLVQHGIMLVSDEPIPQQDGQ